MELDFKHRVVIVTGGTRGIGRAAALAFAREGARVVITYRSDRARAEVVVRELHAAGGEAMLAPFELGAPGSIENVVALASERWERIDVLVNNAVDWGSSETWGSAFEGIPPAAWRASLDANLAGPYAAVQAVLPAMRARASGRIINVSSIIAVDGMAGSGAYAAAKGGIHALTRSLSKELSPAGILTNAIMPGLTLTETNVERLTSDERTEYAAMAAVQRLLTPEEVVPIIVFLASAANTAITGEIIRVSGG